jgi:hypothetical protein
MAGSKAASESAIYSPHGHREQNGPMSRFAAAGKSADLPGRHPSRHTRPAIEKIRFEALKEAHGPKTHPGADAVTSISYLPATFTTLFFLAAGLLLGYIQ